MKLRTLTVLGVALAGMANAQAVNPYRSLGTAYEPISTSPTVITSTSTATCFVSDTTSANYRLVSTRDAHLVIGDIGVRNPSATLNNTFLPAYSPEVWPISDRRCLGVRTDAADNTTGTLYIDKLKK